MGEEAQDDAPYWEAAQLSVLAGAGGLQHCKEEGGGAIRTISIFYPIIIYFFDYLFFYLEGEQ